MAGRAAPQAKCRAVKSGTKLAAGAFETMPYSVLQPVQRRRRSRSKRPLVLLAVAALVAAGSLAATQHWAFAHGTPHHKQATAMLTPKPVSARTLERLRAVAPGQQGVALNREGLRARERVPVWKLMYGLLLFSGNDDALELAIATAGSKGAFLRLMNEKAVELGLHDTHYTSPSGVVDRGNYSSAHDLAALARYAMAIPRFRAITRTHIAHIKWAKPTYAKTYVNKNLLIGTYRGADGVKTGWTTIAGHCLVASARRGGTRLIAVVLHSPDPYGDARRMLNFGFANP